MIHSLDPWVQPGTDHAKVKDLSALYLKLNHSIPTRRADPPIAAGTAFSSASDDLSITMGCEQRDLPRCVIAAASCARDRVIGLSHRAKGVENLLTIETNIFIQGHDDLLHH